MLLEKLTALECSLHGTQRHDREWLETLLHPEFSEITRSGMWVNRAETIESLTHERSVTPLISSDFRLIITGNNVALLCYKTCHADGSRAALRTSYWTCSGSGEWTLFFHQGTPEAGSQ